MVVLAVAVTSLLKVAPVKTVADVEAVRCLDQLMVKMAVVAAEAVRITVLVETEEMVEYSLNLPRNQQVS